MKVTVSTHYDDTEPIAGTFMPDGPGEEVQVLKADTSGKDGAVAEWKGNKCSVRIIERKVRYTEDERQLAVWISAADKQGTVHTVELPQGVSEGSFGYVSVLIA